MSTKPTVFIGPSLNLKPARAILDADYRPPVRCGDVYRAVRDGAIVIGIIDGVFEGERSVWHKEILWALSEGVVVYGAASMGALRAVELAPFGMRGVGQIYKWYVDGMIEDDEEVAVLHGPRELNYGNLNEATVNVRATLQHALALQKIDQVTSAEILTASRSIYFKERTRERLFKEIQRLFEHKQIAYPVEGKDDSDALINWLESNWIDLKNRDARKLLMIIKVGAEADGCTIPEFEFQETLFWRNFVNEYA